MNVKVWGCFCAQVKGNEGDGYGVRLFASLELAQRHVDSWHELPGLWEDNVDTAELVDGGRSVHTLFLIDIE